MVEIVNGKLEVDVYRKPTSTQRLIPSDSFHDYKHKMAAYHSMAHFMVNLPLTDEKVVEEVKKIVEIGKVNGYKESTIMHIIKKHQRKKAQTDVSTFYGNQIQDEPKRRVGIRYYPEVTKKLRPIYASHKLEVVHRNEGTLKQLLGSVKDVPPDLHKSGVYRIQCSHCGRFYFGMTVRKLFVRFNEHINSARWKTKTAVGRHICSPKHNVHISDLKLVQEVRQKWKVEYYESIHIHKNKHQHLLNADHGNIKSPLLNLFTLKRTYDGNVIDLTEDTPNVSFNEEFFDCM